MTREEAFERLKDGAPFSELLDAKWEDAINMAIDALKQEPRPKGHWEFDKKGYFSCSECKRKPKDQTATTDFCPHCGADMREGE